MEEHWEHGLLGCPEIAHNLARSNIDNIVNCVDHPRVQSDDLREEGVLDGLGERICQTRFGSGERRSNWAFLCPSPDAPVGAT